MHLIKRMPRLFEATRLQQYLGYQRFFLACDGELRFVGRRPTRVRPKAEDTSGVWPKPETAHEKPLAPRVLQQERRLKSEFAFFQSLWRLFLPTYFVNCRRTVLKQNFKGPYLILEREIKFCRCLVTFFIKREIRHFHVVVVQKRERNIQKVWCTCKVVVLLIKPIVFMAFSLPSASLDLKVPNEKKRGTTW